MAVLAPLSQDGRGAGGEGTELVIPLRKGLQPKANVANLFEITINN